jgi:hypothetical protein
MFDANGLLRQRGTAEYDALPIRMLSMCCGCQHLTLCQDSAVQLYRLVCELMSLHGEGARVKAMRCAGAGPIIQTMKGAKRAIDAGLGINLDLTGSGITPVVRIML